MELYHCDTSRLVPMGRDRDAGCTMGITVLPSGEVVPDSPNATCEGDHLVLGWFHVTGAWVSPIAMTHVGLHTQSLGSVRY